MKYVFHSYDGYQKPVQTEDLDDHIKLQELGYPTWVVDNESPNVLYMQHFFGGSLIEVPAPTTFENPNNIPTNVVSFYLTTRLIGGEF